VKLLPEESFKSLKNTKEQNILYGLLVAGFSWWFRNYATIGYKESGEWVGEGWGVIVGGLESGRGGVVACRWEIDR